jgi:hypothetical protein
MGAEPIMAAPNPTESMWIISSSVGLNLSEGFVF